MFKKIVFLTFILLFSVNVILAESVYEITTKFSALRGEWDKVVEDTQNWLKEEPGNPVAHLLASLGYHFTKEYQKSYFEAKILMKDKGKQNKVIRWAEDLVKENPQYPLAHYILTSAYSCMSYGNVDTEEGKEKIKKVLKHLRR